MSVKYSITQGLEKALCCFWIKYGWVLIISIEKNTYINDGAQISDCSRN